jgi:hypothetical protein
MVLLKMKETTEAYLGKEAKNTNQFFQFFFLMNRLEKLLNELQGMKQYTN